MKKTLSLFAGALFWIFPATAQIPEAQPSTGVNPIDVS